MMLMVTSRRALESGYGADGYTKIRSTLDAFAEAAGAKLSALDDRDDMSGFGVQPAVGTDAGSLLLSIRSLKRAIGGIDSLLLIGGDNIIPFWQITNPVTDRSIDPDAVVYTDNPYGTDTESLEQYLAPPLPLGRLPDFARGTVDDFVNLIASATDSRKSRAIRQGSTALVNAEWSDFSKGAAGALPSIDWHLSPGYSLNQTTQADANREFLYFNLHGFDGKPDWQGYDSVSDRFVTAATPAGFDRQYVSGSVVFAENCYGAQVSGRTATNSCALKLVNEGAAFVGATGLAFGSHIAPTFILEDADALAKSFWGEFAASGSQLGASLAKARSDYLQGDSAISNNPFKQKTLLQFVLLGDPGWN